MNPVKHRIEGKSLTEISNMTGINILTIRTRFRKNPNITLKEICRPLHSGGNRKPHIFVDGMTVREIAEKRGVECSDVYRWIKKGWRPDDPIPTRGNKK